MKLLDNIRALPLPRQLMLVGAVASIVIAMFLLARGATQPPMALLYAGLEPQYAGEIVEQLDRTGVPYKIEGGAIFIPEAQRDQVRFALAREGLPRQSVQGYELLDEVNGFSVTSEMYNAAYWRAKEGELTRTILAIPGISSARVHIGASLRSGFSRSQPPQTASVTLTTAHDFSKSQAEAIQYLVALAVAGLNPDDVAVIDPRKGILAGPNSERLEEAPVIAETEAATLERKILRLLEARVGPGNARVSATVDVSRERQIVSAVTFDPQSRVVRNRTVSDTNESNGGGTGALTVASNLPEGAGGGQPTSSTSRNSSESVVYEINETRTETEQLPGQIRRVSIAVLLNETALGIDPAAAGAAAVSEALLTDLRELVISGAGLNPERGDTVSVEVMPFQASSAEELVPAPGLVTELVDRYFWSALQALLLGIVVIVLALGVVRPLLMPKVPPAIDAAGMPAVAADAAAAAAPAAEQDPINYLQDYVRERSDDTAALLRQWLDEDRKAAVNE